nr:BAF_HP1_G0052990.mRNA.1.CDS.1 [Saccharomyces cerevisiae]
MSETARSTIDGLIESLGWIELNYRCERQCNWDEVCYTPSWGPSPMGMTVPGSHNEDLEPTLMNLDKGWLLTVNYSVSI